MVKIVFEDGAQREHAEYHDIVLAYFPKLPTAREDGAIHVSICTAEVFANIVRSYDALIVNDKKIVIGKANANHPTAPIIDTYGGIINDEDDSRMARREIIMSANFANIKYLHENLHHTFVSSDVLDATGCPLEVFKYIQERSAFHRTWIKKICAIAARRGHADVLEYAMRNLSCPVDECAVIMAIEGSHLVCLERILSFGNHNLSSICALAAVDNDNLAALKLLRAAHCSLDSSVLQKAAEKGMLACVEYLCSEQCPMDAIVLCAAVYARRIDIWEYLCRAGCPMSEMSCTLAAEYCRLDMLKSMREWKDPLTGEPKPCPWDANVYIAVAVMSKVDDDEAKMAIVRYAIENECPTSPAAFMAAVESGNVDILRAMREFVVRAHRPASESWDEVSCVSAARGGHADALRFLLEEGCPTHPLVCAMAASRGYLHIIKLAREHNCEWDYRTLQAAMKAGHLDIVKYAIANGCPSEPTNEPTGDRDDDHDADSKSRESSSDDDDDDELGDLITRIAREYGYERV